MLDNWLCDSNNIHLLKAIPAKERYCNITGNRNQGNRIQISVGNARNQIRCPRATGRQYDADFAARPRITVGCKGCPLLVGRGHVADPVSVAVEFIVDIQHSATRVAK